MSITTPPSLVPLAYETTYAAAGQVVHHTVAQGKGQNHQGCDAAGPGSPHSHVQLPRIQRSPSPRSPTTTPISTLTSCRIDTKVVYRRYASLFFIAGCDSTDNELITLEIVHRYVEQMDKYYGNVCELDIIFNFQKAYFILDELLLAGEMQESSKKNVLRCIGQQDSLEDMEVSNSPLLTCSMTARRPPLFLSRRHDGCTRRMPLYFPSRSLAPLAQSININQLIMVSIINSGRR